MKRLFRFDCRSVGGGPTSNYLSKKLYFFGQTVHTQLIEPLNIQQNKVTKTILLAKVSFRHKFAKNVFKKLEIGLDRLYSPMDTREKIWKLNFFSDRKWENMGVLITWFMDFLQNNKNVFLAVTGRAVFWGWSWTVDLGPVSWGWSWTVDLGTVDWYLTRPQIPHLPSLVFFCTGCFTFEFLLCFLVLTKRIFFLKRLLTPCGAPDPTPVPPYRGVIFKWATSLGFNF